MIKFTGADAFGVHNFLQHGHFNKIDLTILGVWNSIKFKKTLDAIAAVSVEVSKDFNNFVQLTQKILVDKFPVLANELTELFKSQNLFMSYQVFYDKLPSANDNNDIFTKAKAAKLEIDKAIDELKQFWSDELTKEHTLATASVCWDNDKLARAVEVKLSMNEFAMIAFLFEDDANKLAECEQIIETTKEKIADM